MESTTYKTGEFSQLTGVGIKTLQKWDREKKLIANRTGSKLSPERERVEDLMTITDCFSARLNGLRSYKKALAKAVKDDTSAQDTAEPNA